MEVLAGGAHKDFTAIAWEACVIHWWHLVWPPGTCGNKSFTVLRAILHSTRSYLFTLLLRVNSKGSRGQLCPLSNGQHEQPGRTGCNSVERRWMDGTAWQLSAKAVNLGS